MTSVYYTSGTEMKTGDVSLNTQLLKKLVAPEVGVSVRREKSIFKEVQEKVQ